MYNGSGLYCGSAGRVMQHRMRDPTNPSPHPHPHPHSWAGRLTRDIVLLAQRDSGLVHDVQPALQHVAEGQLAVQLGMRVLHWVAVVHTVHLRG